MTLPNPFDASTQVCIDCGQDKPLSEFGWSKRKHAPTKRCIACWKTTNPGSDMKRDRLVPSLIAIYEEVRGLMEQIHKASFEQLVREEWDEQAMRLIMRGLVIRASDGDREAAKLILDVRLKLRAQSDGSEDEGVNLAALLASDPIAPDPSSA